jgi:hypothetical protein
MPSGRAIERKSQWIAWQLGEGNLVKEFTSASPNAYFQEKQWFPPMIALSGLQSASQARRRGSV